MDSCDNCGRNIGKLEKSHIWRGENTVCANCLATLQQQAAPSEDEIEREIRRASPVRSSVVPQHAAYSAPPPARPSIVAPTLLTIGGFFPCAWLLFYVDQLREAQRTVEPWILFLLLLSGAAFLIGLGWFAVQRVRKD